MHIWSVWKWEESNHYNSNCVSAAGCCSIAIVNTERQEHVKTENVGHR